MDGNWYNFSEIVSIRLLKRKGKETKTKCLMDGNWCNFSEISGSLPCPICTTLKLNEVLKSYLYSLLNFLWTDKHIILSRQQQVVVAVACV